VSRRGRPRSVSWMGVEGERDAWTRGGVVVVVVVGPSSVVSSRVVSRRLSFGRRTRGGDGVESVGV